MMRRMRDVTVASLRVVAKASQFMGTGECAGEVISVTQFDLADAERLVFEAQLELENENYAQADALAYRAMIQAALSLVKTQSLDVKDDPNTIVNEFRRRFYDTGILGDRYAGNKFAEYLFRRHDAPPHEHAPALPKSISPECRAEGQGIRSKRSRPLSHRLSTGNDRTGCGNSQVDRLS